MPNIFADMLRGAAQQSGNFAPTMMRMDQMQQQQVQRERDDILRRMGMLKGVDPKYVAPEQQQLMESELGLQPGSFIDAFTQPKKPTIPKIIDQHSITLDPETGEPVATPVRGFTPETASPNDFMQDAMGEARKYGTKGGLALLKGSLGRDLTKEETEFYYPLLSDVAGTKQGLTALQSAFEDVVPYIEKFSGKWAADQFTLRVKALNEEGYNITAEDEKQFYDQLLSADKLLASRLEPAQKTRMIELRQTQNMVDAVLDVIDDSDVRELLGPIQSNWTAVKALISQDDWEQKVQSRQIALTPKQRQAVFKIKYLTEKMGRSLTGAAVQDFERVVFEQLFGGLNREGEEIKENLSVFKQLLEAEETEIWKITYDTRFGYNPVYEANELINRIPEDLTDESLKGK